MKDLIECLENLEADLMESDMQVNAILVEHTMEYIEKLENAILIQTRQDEGVREFGSMKATIDFFTCRYTDEHFPKEKTA